jgi:sarcosine oxidase subunit alpha
MCHFNSLSACAVLTGQTITAVGRTTARPPVHPVSLGVLAGPGWEPVRRTPMHRQHETAGATWMDMGAWKRPAVYTSVEEECRRIHDAVGLIDVTTLGKLDVQGRDAAPFLDWIHSNRIANLAVGRIRYRLMLDDSGVIVDDGTVARLADDHFFVTTGTGSLEQVQEWLEWWLADGRRCVHVTDVTAAYAAINVAGPRSRELLQGISDGDWSNTAVPYLQAARRGVAGVPVIALRIGFLGELGYELHFPAEYGGYLWNTLLEAGGRLGIAPVGIQAQRVLRLEKLHLIPGYDTDSVSNPLDADLAWCVKLDKPDFIGRAALARSDVTTGQRLVGFQMANGAVPEEGAAIVVNGKPVGRVTSAKWSERLNRGIGLAWVPAELGQADSELPIRVDGRIEVGRVLNRPPHDPDGARLRS